MGKASLGSTSNILGIHNTPAPATSELADAESAVMGLAPRLELGGQAKDNVLRHLHRSRCFLQLICHAYLYAIVVHVLYVSYNLRLMDAAGCPIELGNF